MKYKILPITIFILLLFGCSREVTTINIVRDPTIKASIDSISWTADNYNFLAPVKVVQYPADPTASSRLYNRYTLQATGTDEKGNNLQLIITFDAVDNNQLVGTYKPKYSDTKGLEQVQVFNLNSSTLAAYRMCDTAFTSLFIRKQSISEKLIAGSFQARLCNIRDTTRKIRITNGVITDIRYR